MNFLNKIFRFICCVIFSAGCLHPALLLGNNEPGKVLDLNQPAISQGQGPVTKKSKGLEPLNDSLRKFLSANDLVRARSEVLKLSRNLDIGAIGDSIVWDSYYLTGLYYIVSRSYNDGITYLDNCISVKETNKEYDNRYAKALYNLSVAYSGLGDLHQFEFYARKSLEIWERIFGKSNLYLLHANLSLAIAYTDKNEYEKAISNLNIAMDIADKNPGKVPAAMLSNLYYSLGVCYSRVGDYSEAKIYFDKTESIFKNSKLDHNDEYINLMNGQALTCNSLGMKDETAAYYEEGIRLANSNNSSLAFNMINSYCVFLANNKKSENGELILRNALKKAKIEAQNNPRSYFEVLQNYAGYLRENKIDLKLSVECYQECLQYLNRNKNDIELRTSIYIGYAHALEDSGEKEEALGIIRLLLFPEGASSNSAELYDNPLPETLKPDIKTLKILKLKYNILWDLYKKKADLITLEAASNTSELIVSLLDKVRININEEESRLILGDKYRESYLNTIRDLNILYHKTNDHHYLEKAFEYSEKSKAAGLLTSTRELKASQFNIPPDIANYERELQREISLINVHISEESYSNKPDMALIGNWKENLLRFSRKRDSLILVFEKQYPEYYAIKYNTHMAGLNDIPGIVGRNGNYINYVVSDTVLYTFVVNRTYQQLFAVTVDSSFMNDIRLFRSLLSMPLPSDNASLKFKEFQNVGYRLYKTLIQPIRSSLISDKIFISPDNILSYLPFETIPTSVIPGEGIRYRDVSYLMNNYDISYTYSATFMAETVKKEFTKRNKLIAFAPDYPEPIDIQSALKSRQVLSGVLNDLPYARQEAKYVTDITGGNLFENSRAKESVYKLEAGKYDIIHLAMHTLLNDKDPMHSTLIFSRRNDSPEDGYLKTYEIYGIPLKAKMVVLSSCNTGTGQLYSGEGILSLARGFIYSGSESVIMSMWEIEDKSGTKIVEMFYDNLKKGYQKSVALKKARTTFLNNADQLRSHPYYWSALVVYGDDTPLYYSNNLATIIVTILIVFIAGLVYYFRRRKYS